MAKLTDAQTAALQRGALHMNGFISPAAKTPEHMARLQAQKLAAMGLVQEAPCAFDEPVYFRDEEGGATLGYRVTAAGFEALGIDGSEWPAYATQDPDADDGAPYVSPTGNAALEGQDDLAASLAAGVPAKGLDEDGPTEPYEVNGSCEFGQPELDTSGIEGSVPDGAPAVLPVKRSLQVAAAGVLDGWARIAADGTLDTIQVLQPLMAALQAAMPVAKVAKAAKPAGEPGVPKAGSKLALVIGLLSRPGGAIAAEVETATGWNNTSTRGFISSLKIKRGLAVASAKEAGTTRYWIGAENAPALPEAAPAKVAKEAEAAF